MDSLTAINLYQLGWGKKNQVGGGGEVSNVTFLLWIVHQLTFDKNLTFLFYFYPIRI